MLDYNEFYLYLVRHGQTTANTMPDMLGQTGNSQLTERGRHQAKLLGQRFNKEKRKLDFVWTSPYDRARDTCEIALSEVPKGQKPPLDYSLANELREYDAGDWTHSSRKEVHTLPVQLRMANMNSGFTPPKGESMHMVERRASQWLEDNILYNKEMMQKASQHCEAGIDPPHVYLFSHGMTIKCLLRYIIGIDQGFIWKLTLENTSICQLHFGEEGWRLLTINDHAHLL